MCTTCGCSTGQTRINGKTIQSLHLEKPIQFRPLRHSNTRDHTPSLPIKNNCASETLASGAGITTAHAPGMSQARMIKIERDILERNNQYANENRRFLSKQNILALNLLSSPGSGKTTLLVNTIQILRNKLPITVIEGDQQTDHDAARIRETGISATQINTGKGCHLDAFMVQQAMQQISPQQNSLLFIENVGNLVCPSNFDLGEAYKIVILSVTEGEDKPLKYPDMFHAADLMLLNKCDLLPYLSFDVDLAIEYAHHIHPGLPVIQISAMQGSGMQVWIDWIEANRLALPSTVQYKT
ncbi:hydrogenase nickel incorporation protein HypB [uncultured Nitrosomonas sp.]|uniref:hydrogenase nickel incorporation protein HypB n=1 Tax=uncultured Nitrosomonas sp. TaxID=156424 RepID=UPI0025EA7455|nr:hydrogenase nickel incorporation protein HypB [uncultured Nitrosomonas sp.]